MNRRTFAIVGASLAGAHAAHHLRKEGFDGRIVLIGGEPHLPYDRPPLSKEVLLGKSAPETTALWSESDYAKADIEIVLGTRVTRIRPTERLLELDNGHEIVADGILLCTGSHPVRLPIPGLDQKGVYALRTLDDCICLRDALLPGAAVVIIGFGFIGAEVAAAAAERGCQVTLIETAPLPMQRVLGPEIGRLYCDLHKQHGVDVRLGVTVTEVRGTGHCQSVVLADGAEVRADVVIYGVGARPSTELAATAGATVANGIVVDPQCRTSIDGIFACGDVAARPSSFSGGRIRLECWQNACKQALAAAKSMLGSSDAFDDLPWFWSDQYDVRMQMAGIPSPGDEIVWRGAPDSFNCLALFVSGDRVRAALAFNRPRDLRAAMDLIRTGRRVDRAALADESVNLRSLAAAGAGPT